MHAHHHVLTHFEMSKFCEHSNHSEVLRQLKCFERPEDFSDKASQALGTASLLIAAPQDQTAESEIPPYGRSIKICV